MIAPAGRLCYNTVVKSSPSARALAHHCLLRWARGGVFAESLIAQESKKYQLGKADRALLQNIVYNTLRQINWLEHICSTLRQGPLEDDVRWLLCAALAELFILEMPAYAVVDEAVKLSPRRVQGLVNAILRSALRQKDEILAEKATLPLWVQFSTPKWLVNRWLDQLGEEETRALLAWNLRPSAIYAHMNPQRPMAEVPVEWKPLENLTNWYQIVGPLPTEALQAGQLYIADPSTRHCVEMLAPQRGERILDACAAPGGKAVAMIYATGGEIELLACDLKEHRLAPLRENIERADCSQVELAAHDWTQPCPEEWVGGFDAVLIDLPCSNSGVLQRRVDARWRICPEEMKRIEELQLKITHEAARAVKSGGRLVYSTCSIEASENDRNVERFLASHPEFSLVRSHLALPHKEQADGAYAALLQKA